jgi:hypothetical protein
LNEVINNFIGDDPKAIKKCKEITDSFLSEGSGSGQHQVTAIGNCHIGMNTRTRENTKKVGYLHPLYFIYI